MSEPTYGNQLMEARRLHTNDLSRHAARAAMEEGARCKACFCCAAEDVLAERFGPSLKTRRLTFENSYRARLKEVREKYPEEYPWPVENVDSVATKMLNAIFGSGNGPLSWNKDGRAIKMTCKDLGIKHTYAAIAEYVRA